MKISEIKENPRNPRKIGEKEFLKLKNSIKRDPKFMELRPIIVDDNGIILGGNQRYNAIKSLGMEEIPDNWVKKASGLSEKEKKRFIIIDNSPDAISGVWDFLEIAENFSDIGLDFSLIEEIEDEEIKEKEEETIYEKKVKSPIYEMKGEKPAIRELFDRGKFDELLEQIENSDIDEESKDFLRLAASRHICFNYQKIAEFYAHASKEVQILMENSFLVVIDFNKAIEDGFVKLSSSILEIAENDK